MSRFPLIAPGILPAHNQARNKTTKESRPAIRQISSSHCNPPPDGPSQNHIRTSTGRITRNSPKGYHRTYVHHSPLSKGGTVPRISGTGRSVSGFDTAFSVGRVSGQKIQQTKIATGNCNGGLGLWV